MATGNGKEETKASINAPQKLRKADEAFLATNIKPELSGEKYRSEPD